MALLLVEGAVDLWDPYREIMAPPFCLIDFFSDQKEKYVKPDKGPKHAYEIINTIFKLKPNSTRTDLNKAMLMALSTIFSATSAFIKIVPPSAYISPVFVTAE